MSTGAKYQRNYDSSNEYMEDILKAKRYLTIGCIVLFLAITLLKSFYTVNSQECVVLLTFGKAQEVMDPGAHFKIPYIQKVKRVTKEILGMNIGYSSNNESILKESMMITRDFNIVNVDFYIEYRVTDPVKALYRSDCVDDVLKNLAQSYIRDTVGLYQIDEVLTSGKNEIQAAVKEKLVNRLAKDNLGIQVLNVTIQDSELPTNDVSTAFKNVENAKQEKDKKLNEAAMYENEQLPAARTKADAILKDAAAYKAERINEATGQVVRYNEMYEEYVKFPQITKERMFFETIESLLPNKKVIIDNGDGTQKLLPLDSLVTTSEKQN